MMVKKAWIDARHPMVNKRLWGLTLLERNLRELEKLGCTDVVVMSPRDIEPRKHFCHPLPVSLRVTFVDTDASQPFESLQAELQKRDEPILALEGHALNDSRVLQQLIAAPSSCAVISPHGPKKAGAAILMTSDLHLFHEGENDSLSSLLSTMVQQSRIPQLRLAHLDTYIESMRRSIEPYLLSIETENDLREADTILRQRSQKGVLELVGKYIHPPLEFGAVRFLASTPVTPNQITILWLVLAGLVGSSFAQGQLLLGVMLAAIIGVLDGIDGKLARMTLRFSKVGDVLDHIGGAIYDAIWYLVLGWYFSQGDVSSTAGTFTAILVLSYSVERIVAGIFRKIHKVGIHDYTKFDESIRLVISRMNNNVWCLMIGVIVGFAREAFYFISIWMLVTATWHTLRLIWVTWQSRVKAPAMVN
jgi:phosphatidylglycerophosphate synthase